MKVLLRYKGGHGSGHFGHSGRQGKVGGSIPGKGNYGAFGNDKKLYEWASRYIRGYYSPPQDYDEPRKPWDIYHEAQIARDYRKDKNADIEGIELIGKGTFTDDGQYIENKKYITNEQFAQVYHEIQGEYHERLDYIFQASGLPANYKDFLAGKDFETIKNVWQLPREQLSAEYDEAQMRGVAILEGMKANGYDVLRDFTRQELKSGIFEEYRRQMKDDHPEESYPEGWLEMVGEGLGKQYDFDAKHMICLGELSIVEAKEVGADISLGGHRDFEYLPSKLYHAATNAKAIEESQLMSRRELGQNNGLGLGGGEDDTISFTDNEDIAINIERSLHEAHLVASGQIKIGDLLEMAKDGAGAKKSYIDSFVGIGRLSAFERLAEIDAAGGGDGYTAERIAEKRWSLYHIDWLNARQYTGEGFENPVFFSTDWRALAKVDPQQFKTLSYIPKPGAKGQQMGSLAEWRVVGGDVVDLFNTYDAFDPDDWGSILDLEKYK